MCTPYGVLLGDPVFRGGVHVVQMEQLESNWTPHGFKTKDLLGYHPKKNVYSPHGICGGG